MTCLPTSVEADTNEGVLYEAGVVDDDAGVDIKDEEEPSEVDGAPSITLPEVP